jgi:hypothetical protein
MEVIMRRALLFLLATFSILYGTVTEQVYRFPTPSFTTDSHGYQVPIIAGTMNSAPAGSPLLPYRTVNLILPPGEAATSIEVVCDKWIPVREPINLAPAQPARRYSDTTPARWIIDESQYRNAEYPATAYGTLTTRYQNGFALAQTVITPFRWHPVDHSLEYCPEMTVRIVSTPDDKAWQALNNLTSHIDMAQSVKHNADNPSAASAYSLRDTRPDDYDVLIITRPAFHEGLQPLVDLYTREGLRVQVTNMTDVIAGNEGRDHPERLRNYLISQYQQYGIRFVLLAGDVDTVPYRGFFCGVQSSDYITDDAIPADLYYSALDGSWNDNDNDLWGEIGEDDLAPELAVGRLPVETTTELVNLVWKIYLYQTEPVQDELNRPILLGEKLLDDPFTLGSDYLNLLVGSHDDNGYTTDGIPEDSGYVTLYDTASYEYTRSEMLSLLNDGGSFIHHVGHANFNYLMRLPMDDIDGQMFSPLDGVEHNLPLLYTHGCICGAFDVDCIAETMLTLPNFISGFVGNSRYGWFNEGQTEGPSPHLHREFVNALYGLRENRLGEAHRLSKAASAPFVNAPGQWEEGALRWCFYDNNVLGDPVLAVWTGIPAPVTVSYPTTIPTGAVSLPVEVTSTGDNTGLTCAVSMNGVVLGCALTDATGSASIAFDTPPAISGTAELTISGYNRLLTSCPVYIVADSTAFLILDSNPEISISVGEPANLPVTIENIGALSTGLLTATLVSSDPNIQWTPDTLSIPTIASGESHSIENAFSLTVSVETTDATVFRLTLNLTNDTGDSWEFPLSVHALAPRLTVCPGSFIETGDTAGILEPGETGVYRVPVMNTGHNVAESVSIQVTTADPNLAVGTELYNCGQLQPNSTHSFDIPVTLSDTTQDGDATGFYMTICDSLKTFRARVILTIGGITDDLRNFTTLPYLFEGAADWYIDAESTEGFCARSGVIDNNQRSVLTVTLDNLSAGQIGFYRKVSCEDAESDDGDRLVFSIDGTELDRWDGETDWAQTAYSFTGGTHTFSWEYVKNDGGFAGSDCAWIDNITLPSLFTVPNGPGTSAPAQTELFANAPNPFNPETRIDFTLALTGSVTLTIYDLRGRKIRSLINGLLPRGAHSVSWNGTDDRGRSVSSGVYMYRLQSGEVQLTRKCVLMK